jgi:hypothetical protein
MLRGEPTLELADPDAVDHLSAAANAAALIETLAAHPGPRILKAADPSRLRQTAGSTRGGQQ